MHIFKKLFISVVVLVGLSIFIQAHTNAQNLYSAVPVSDSGTTGNSIANANTSRCLAVTADGVIYAVYHGSNGIRVAKSTNRGASFSPSVLVKNSNFESEIAVSSTGTVYVTWVENGNAYLSKSTDNGTTFSSPINIGTATTSVHMAVDGNYVYLIDRIGTTFYYSSDSGQTFTKITFSEQYVFSDVHINRLTGEVIVQKDKPDIVYYVSQDHGKTFSDKKAANASVNYSVGSISAGPLGSYLFIGGYNTMGARINLADASAKTLSLGSSLTPQGRSLSVDGFGNVVTGFISNGNVYYAASKDLGDTFGSTTNVAVADMANAAINTTNGDVMFLYSANGRIYLSVFGDELTGYSLDVSTTNLNFGNQEVGTSSAKKDITVTNKSTKAIAVNKLDITGSDFSVSHNIGSTLNPGQSYTISVVFTPSKFNTCSGMISIYTDASKDPRIIQLSGSGADTTIPNTAVQISGKKGSDGKYTGDVTLKFNASDIAGIAKTEYSLNNGQSWIQASGSATFSNEGDYNVQYRSVDKANNVETAKQISFTIKLLPKTVTLTYSSGGHGNIAGQASQTVDFGGSGTEVTAVPDTGYHFVSWSDGVTTPKRTDSNVSSDKSVTATFAINTYTLKYFGVHGSISGSASQTVNFGGSGSEVTAVPDTGYHFVSWSDGVATPKRTDSNVSSDKSVTATFAVNTYTLKYSSEEHGSVSGSALQTVNFGGSGTEVTAVPDTGYHFVKWSDNVTTAARTDRNVSSDKSVTATFAINTYTLKYSGVHGSISGSASQTVNFGESGTEVTALPDKGYHFKVWSDGNTNASRTEGNISSDINLTATFEINSYALIYSGEHGSISGSASQIVNYGGSGTKVTAVPDTGYHFVSWSDGKSDVSRTDENITTDTSITATFEINTYTLKYSSGEHGSISGSASQPVNFGESGTEVTAVPDEGYHFKSWSDGNTDARRTDTNISSDINLTATFEINTYTLSYSGVHGSISGSASQKVNHGSSGTEVTAVPDTGYYFVKWSDGETEVSRTDSNVTTNTSITATFAINTYTLNYSSGEHGSISGSASQPVNFGESGTEVTAVPDEGYHFVSWSDGKADARRTDSNISSDINLTATFEINTYTLSYSGVHGSISGSASQKVSHGSSGSEVTAVPDTGYHFAGWSDSITTPSRTDKNITTDTSITATFEINTYTLSYSGVHGSISGSASQKVSHGSSGSEVTAIPDEGYHFVSWSDSKPDASRTDSNITTNISITATFEINKYNLNYSSGEHGSITGSAIQFVNHGGSGTEVTAVPDERYHFVSWSDGKTDARRTDSNVTTDSSITATFSINTYTLKYSGDHGSITGSAIQIVNYGESGTEVTAIPDSGYHFVCWSDGVINAKRIDSNISSNKNISATFAANGGSSSGSGGGGGGGGGGGSSPVIILKEEIPAAAPADLAVSISADKRIYAENQEITYTIDYLNKLDSKTGEFEITADVPSFASVTDNGGGKVDGNIIRFKVPALEGKASGQLTYKLKIGDLPKQEITISNNVKITGTNGIINTDDDKNQVSVMLRSPKYGKLSHKAYIKGYPGNIFKPEHPMTRAEVTVIMSRIMNLPVTSSHKSTFKDVDKTFWGYEYIISASDAGILKGYEDGTFRPDAPISRAELATLVSRYLKLEDVKPLKNYFNDTSNHWANNYIEEMRRCKIIEGYNDGSFKPDEKIKRSEAVTIINKMLYRSPLAAESSSFNDVSKDYWAFGQIEAASSDYDSVIDENGAESLK